MLDIEFGSAGNDNLQPRSLCGCIDQDLQETWTTLSIATLIKRVNNKDDSALQVARMKGADEIKEMRAFYRLKSEVWVVAKVLCYNGSKMGKKYGKFVDESRKDVSGSVGRITTSQTNPASQNRCDRFHMGYRIGETDRIISHSNSYLDVA